MSLLGERVRGYDGLCVVPRGGQGSDHGVPLGALGLSDTSTLAEALAAIMGVDDSVLRTALPDGVGAFEQQLTRV